MDINTYFDDVQAEYNFFTCRRRIVSDCLRTKSTTVQCDCEDTYRGNTFLNAFRPEAVRDIRRNRSSNEYYVLCCRNPACKEDILVLPANFNSIRTFHSA